MNECQMMVSGSLLAWCLAGGDVWLLCWLAALVVHNLDVEKENFAHK